MIALLLEAVYWESVCVLTGSGLKDPDTAATLTARLHELPADLGAIERALGWA